MTAVLLLMVLVLLAVALTAVVVLSVGLFRVHRGRRTLLRTVGQNAERIEVQRREIAGLRNIYRRLFADNVQLAAENERLTRLLKDRDRPASADDAAWAEIVARLEATDDSREAS